MPLMADNWTGPDKNSNYRFDRTSLANNTSAFKCQKSKIWTKIKSLISKLLWLWFLNQKKSRLRLWWLKKIEQTLKKTFDGREELIPPFSNNLRACEIFIDKIYESFAIHLYTWFFDLLKNLNLEFLYII